ncbi:hypothetical protein GCM10020256_05370 [Streptomyces thermocoprophilus]
MPNASDDLPEPDTPVNTATTSRGMSTSTSRRLCSRAPRTRTQGSWESYGPCGSCGLCIGAAPWRFTFLAGTGKRPRTGQTLRSYAPACTGPTTGALPVTAVSRR